VAGVTGATGVFAFDALTLVAETVFSTRTDFFAIFAEAAFFPAVLTFAQRAFCAATILARSSALRTAVFTLFARKVIVVALDAADAAAVLRASFFAAFLDLAQRALWPAAIFSRASAPNARRVDLLT
jgi:hypothetical protein